MALRVATGWGHNVLSRLPSGGLGSTSAHVDYPLADLVDPDVSNPFIFGAVAVEDFTGDLNQIVNGGFETAFVGGLPAAGWGKTGGATVTRDTGTKDTGAASMKVAGSASDYSYFDLQARAGETWRFEVKGYGAASNPARVGIQVLETNQWVAPSGALGAGADFLSNATSAFVPAAATVVMPSFLVALTDRVTVRIYFSAASTAPFYDECYAWPCWDTFSLHGHTVPPAVSVELASGATSSVATARGTMTPKRIAFYSIQSAVVTDRFFRARFTPAIPSGIPIMLGAGILAQSLRLARSSKWGGRRLDFEHPLVTNETPGGEVRAYLLSASEQRRVALDFSYPTLAEYQECRDLLIRARGSNFRGLLIEDGDPEVCIYGTFGAGFGTSHTVPQASASPTRANDVRDGGRITIVESPMATLSA